MATFHDRPVSAAVQRVIRVSPTTAAKVPAVRELLAQAEMLLVRPNQEQTAMAAYQEAQKLSDAEADLLGEGNALRGQALVEGLLGKYERARDLNARALARFQEGTHELQKAFAFMGLGSCESLLGKPVIAKQHYQNAVDIFEKHGLTGEADIARLNLA